MYRSSKYPCTKSTGFTKEVKQVRGITKYYEESKPAFQKYPDYPVRNGNIRLQEELYWTISRIAGQSRKMWKQWKNINSRLLIKTNMEKILQDRLCWWQCSKRNKLRGRYWDRCLTCHPVYTTLFVIPYSWISLSMDDRAEC